MAQTTNIGLYISDDDQETFESWRQKINGVTDSNMVKIDSAIHDAASDNRAYKAAQSGGYAGTEAQFNSDLAALEGLASLMDQI